MKKFKPQRKICGCCGNQFLAKPLGDWYPSNCPECHKLVKLTGAGWLISTKMKK